MRMTRILHGNTIIGTCADDQVLEGTIFVNPDAIRDFVADGTIQAVDIDRVIVDKMRSGQYPNEHKGFVQIRVLRPLSQVRDARLNPRFAGISPSTMVAVEFRIGSPEDYHRTDLATYDQLDPSFGGLNSDE